MRVQGIVTLAETSGVDGPLADHADTSDVLEKELFRSARDVPRRMRTLNHLHIFCHAGKMVQSAGAIWKGGIKFCKKGIDTAAGLC